MKKIVSLVMLFTVLLSGCGAKTPTSDPEVLTIWSWKGDAEVWNGTFDDVASLQAWEEQNGLNVEYIHPTGDESEEFNLMMGTGTDMADMVFWGWFPETQQVYADMGLIWDISPYVTPEIMPNYYALLEENPELRKQVTSEDGAIYYTPQITTEKYYYEGMACRSDWMEATGLDTPTTTDEFYELLKAEQALFESGELPNAGSEFYGLSGYMIQVNKLYYAFGTAKDYYIEDGKIVYGPMTDAYREGTAYLTKLYSEGLMDPDIFSNDYDTYMEHHTTNTTACYIDGTHSFNGVEAALGQPDLYTPIPYLTTTEGEVPQELNSTSKRVAQPYGYAYTTAMSEEELIATLKIVDANYAPEGQDLFNWGIEGESYTVNEDGTKEFTDTIINSENPQVEATKYTYNSFTVVDQAAQEALLDENDIKMRDTWEQTDTTNAMEPFLWYTEEELNTINKYQADVDTYVDEWQQKFITGQEDINDDATWDAYVQGLVDLQVEAILQAKQDAYDRYMAR